MSKRVEAQTGNISVNPITGVVELYNADVLVARTTTQGSGSFEIDVGSGFNSVVTTETLPDGTTADSTLRWNGSSWVEETQVQIGSAGVLSIFDGTLADSVTFSHDGTDFDANFINTTDWNIAGITSIQAGTIDVDFDAITATSYGGITEANLVDKTAIESISGDWTFSGTLVIPEAAVTDHEAALTIAETQITDGSILARVGSSETITEEWFFNRNAVENLLTWANVDQTTHQFTTRFANDGLRFIFLPEPSGSPSFTSELSYDFSTDSWSFDTALDVGGALTAVSYGGITEANLLDKTATETISGSYTYTASTLDLVGAVGLSQLRLTGNGSPNRSIIRNDAAGNFILRYDDSDQTKDLIYIESLGAWQFDDDLFVIGDLSVSSVINIAQGGTQSTPILTWTGDTDTGFYRNTADQISITTGSARQMTIEVGIVGIDSSLRIRNGSSNTNRVDFSHDGTDLNTTFANTADWNVFSLGRLNLFNGASLEVWDAVNTGRIDMSHDGTDANFLFGTTTNWNITGPTSIQAGTVDADFDAITATSYGGILEANLLDGTANETITADWTFTGLSPVTLNGAQPDLFIQETDADPDEGNWIIRANGGNFGIHTATDATPTAQVNQIFLVQRTGTTVDEFEINATLIDINGDLDVSGALTAASYGGILEANLLDSTANETVIGVWTYTRNAGSDIIRFANNDVNSNEMATRFSGDGDDFIFVPRPGGSPSFTSTLTYEFPADAWSVGTDFGVGGDLTAVNLIGAGSGITALNASNISTGTLAVARGGTGATATTGTGNNVLSASPTFTGTVSMAALTATGALTLNGVLTTDNSTSTEVGFKGAPINTQNGNYTLVLADCGRTIYKASGGAGETITIPANGAVAFPVGTVISIINNGGGDLSIAITTNTLILANDGSTGTRTLADHGVATITKVATTTWFIAGAGVT